MNREELKRLCLARLDDCAREHPAGHQGKLAARYLLQNAAGDTVELMFEKGPKTPANLWVEHKRVTELVEAPGLDVRLSPASALFSVKGAGGKLIYGRHSALKPMPDLGRADLVCFQISSIGELDRVLDHLRG